MNEPNDKYDKVLKFIQLAINSPKRVKYRDTMCKKDHEYQDSWSSCANENLYCLYPSIPIVFY